MTSLTLKRSNQASLRKSYRAQPGYVIGGTDDEPGDIINIPPEIEHLLK